jgi:heme A synthase
MNKSGRIALLMVLLALIFAAIGAVAVKFKLTALFMVGWAGVALCILVGFVAVFSAIFFQLRSDNRNTAAASASSTKPR